MELKFLEDEKKQYSIDHLYQSEDWSKLNINNNELPLFNRAIFQAKDIGHFLIIKKKINFLPFYKMRITFGPYIDYNSLEAFDYLLGHIKNIAKEHNVLSIQVHPFTWGSRTNEIITVFKKHGFKRVPFHIYEATMLIDLQKSEDEIFNNFESRGRKAVRQAEMLGITANKVDFTKESFDQFYQLYYETCARTSMIPEQYEKIWNIVFQFSEKDKVFLFFSFFENIPVCAFISYKCGDCLSLIYSGSNHSEDVQKKRPTNFLYWYSIKWAKQMGYKWCDFAGVNSNPIPGSKSEGIRLFKRQFGPKYVEFPGNYEFVNRSFLNWVINKVTPIYSKIALKNARKRSFGIK